MTMSMDNHVGCLGFESKPLRFLLQKPFHELLEKETALGDSFRPCETQFSVVLNKHGIAGRFKEQNGGSIHILVEERQIVAAQPRSLFQVALAEGRSAATFAFCYQRYFETERLQDFDRRS